MSTTTTFSFRCTESEKADLHALFAANRLDNETWPNFIKRLAAEPAKTPISNIEPVKVQQDAVCKANQSVIDFPDVKEKQRFDLLQRANNFKTSYDLLKAICSQAKQSLLNKVKGL